MYSTNLYLKNNELTIFYVSDRNTLLCIAIFPKIDFLLIFLHKDSAK